MEPNEQLFLRGMEVIPNKLVIRASTIRALTSEPIHRRNVKMTKKGVPILKFSETKLAFYSINCV